MSQGGFFGLGDLGSLGDRLCLLATKVLSLAGLFLDYGTSGKRLIDKF